jgi:hypothetical protein
MLFPIRQSIRYPLSAADEASQALELEGSGVLKEAGKVLGAEETAIRRAAPGPAPAIAVPINRPRCSPTMSPFLEPSRRGD